MFDFGKILGTSEQKNITKDITANFIEKTYLLPIVLAYFGFYIKLL